MLMGANGPVESCGSRQVRDGPHGTVEGDDPFVGGALRALELVGRGAALFDPDGRLIAANETAQSYFGPVLSRKRAISALQRGSKEALYGLLQRSAVSGNDLSGPILLRTSEGRAFVVYALHSPWADDQVLLILIDAVERREPSPALLKQLFGLTPAEARLAIEVVRGHGLKGIASALQVSEGTVRTQLKAILAKTNTHRQADLVGLLVRIAQANLMPEHRTRAGLEPNVSGR
jgi:DNA-binding CsgD family transcriptional regulator